MYKRFQPQHQLLRATRNVIAAISRILRRPQVALWWCLPGKRFPRKTRKSHLTNIAIVVWKVSGRAWGAALRTASARLTKTYLAGGWTSARIIATRTCLRNSPTIWTMMTLIMGRAELAGYIWWPFEGHQATMHSCHQVAIQLTSILFKPTSAEPRTQRHCRVNGVVSCSMLTLGFKLDLQGVHVYWALVLARSTTWKAQMAF